MLIDGSRADFLSEVDFLLSNGCYNGRMRRPVYKRKADVSLLLMVVCGVQCEKEKLTTPQPWQSRSNEILVNVVT